MRQFLATVVLTLTALSVSAQEAEIEGVISSQLQAFAADDFDRAFTFASPGIRQMFRTPENFSAMVREGYPMVYRHGSVTFLDLEGEPPRMQQTVMIQDRTGPIHVLEYDMIRQEGTWLIAGVRLLSAPDVGV